MKHGLPLNPLAPDEDQAGLFEEFRRLSNGPHNQRFFDLLAAKINSTPNDPDLWRAKAEVARKMGLLTEAREAYIEHFKRVRGTDSLAPGPNTIIDADVSAKPGYQSSPLLVFDNFLEPDHYARLLEYGQESESDFVTSVIWRGEDVVDESRRVSHTFTKFTESRDFFLDHIDRNFDGFCRDLGIPIFDKGKVEIKLTHYCNGGFFAVHHDAFVPLERGSRVFTFVYYFSEIPAQFEGGELLIFDTKIEDRSYEKGMFTKVVPKPNRLIVFPSWFFHAVGPVRTNSGAFEHGRFGVNGHVRAAGPITGA